MSKSKDSTLTKKVFDYLRDQNRPFSATDILNHFQSDCSKTALTKALDLLICEEKVKEKTYGKQKVFYVNQNVFGDSNNEDLQAMNSKINELSNTLTTLNAQIKKSQDILRELEKTLTTQMAEEELKNVKAEIILHEDKLKKLELKSSNLDPKEMESLILEKDKSLKTYKHRKRIAGNMIDSILEGYPKSKKELLEELDIELDSDLVL